MTDTVQLSPPPSFGAVLARQFRSVGLAARWEAAAITGLLALAAVAAIVTRVGASEEHVGQAGGLPVFVIVGLLAPFVFWKGERLHTHPQLWTLPVERRRHAAAKALAGWGWLMLSIAGFLFWLVMVTLLSGGGLGGEQAELLLPPGALDGPVPRETLTEARWSKDWTWAAPFGAGTVAYLFGTALVVGFKRPLLWLALGVLGFVGLLVLQAEVLGAGPVRAAIREVLSGPFGFARAMSGGVWDLSVEYLDADGRTVVAWTAVQTMAAWLQALAVWLAAGGLALWAALLRHPAG